MPLIIPEGVAIDRSALPNRVYVADVGNDRVLAWADVTTFANGDPADLVIGQPNFFSSECNAGGLSATTLCDPRGVAVDAAGNLYVADKRNSRVLEYGTPLTSDVNTTVHSPSAATGCASPARCVTTATSWTEIAARLLAPPSHPTGRPAPTRTPVRTAIPVRVAGASGPPCPGARRPVRAPPSVTTRTPAPSIPATPNGGASIRPAMPARSAAPPRGRATCPKPAPAPIRRARGTAS